MSFAAAWLLFTGPLWANLEEENAVADGPQPARVQAHGQSDDLRAAEEMAARRLRWGLVAGGGLVLLAVCGWLFFTRRTLEFSIDSLHRVVRQMGVHSTEQEGGPATAKSPKHGLELAGSGGPGNPIRIELSPDRFAGQRLGLSLGRHPDLVDEVVAEASVSRRHLRISARGDRFFVEDLNSSNGTFMDEQRLKPFRPVCLNYGTKIAMGDLVLVASKL